MKTEKKNIEKRSGAKRLFWGLGVVALFACGIMLGVGLGDKSENVIQLSKNECISLKNNLLRALNTSGTSAERIAELKDIYFEFCGDVDIEEPKPVVKETKQSNESKEACQIIEGILLEQLGPEDAPYYDEHENNIAIYEKLVMNGCSENQMKYHKKIQREQEIMRALRETVPTKETCQRVEDSLLSRLPSESNNSDNRIERAKIYANLSERGCAQNSQKYVELAKQELEIARALEDDEFEEGDAIEVVETYKRLNMQAAAQEILDTAKKLTDPAIDFILELEKIINQ